MIFELQSSVELAISIVMFAIKGFALVDLVLRSSAAVNVQSALSKQAWGIILGLAVVVHLLWWQPLTLLNLAGTVAALVYLAQMRGSARL